MSMPAPLKVKPKRRKRSKLSEEDCVLVFKQFARRVQRMGETSSGGMFKEFAGNGEISAHFLLNGNFGTSENLFEAIRVLGGHKLPRKVK